MKKLGSNPVLSQTLVVTLHQAQWQGITVEVVTSDLWHNSFFCSLMTDNNGPVVLMLKALLYLAKIIHLFKTHLNHIFLSQVFPNKEVNILF